VVILVVEVKLLIGRRNLVSLQVLNKVKVNVTVAGVTEEIKVKPPKKFNAR
jgi:hypothetical protein